MARAKPPTKGLVFYPNSHRYRLDGRWVQGVTTLIKQGLPNDALKFWAARYVAEYVADNRDQVGRLYGMGRGPMVAALKETPFQYRDEAAVKGTDVHALAERIVGGEEVDVPEHLVPYVESCIGFLEDHDIQPTLVEAVVGSREHGYAGKLDLVANAAIWDYKTGASGIWPETAFQLSAHAHAEFHGEHGDEHPLPEITAAYGVHLRPDGYDVYPLQFGADVFEEFLDLAKVARIAKRAKGDKNTPGYVKPALQPLEETA
jgi:hypothetical protein